MISGKEARAFGIRLLRARTARDQQRRVGASNLAQPCDFHLAAQFRGDARRPDYLEFGDDERAWLGGVIGTGIHGLLEQRALDLNDPDLVSERKILLGVIPGYGEVWSTPDLASLSAKHLFDYKSSKREKSSAYHAWLGRKSKVTSESKIEAAGATLETYRRQTLLYSRGLRANGVPIDGNSLIFVNRDGTGWFDSAEWEDYDNESKTHDVWEWTFPYDEEIAEAAWQRACDIYDDVANGRRNFPRNKHCYPCQVSQAQIDGDPNATVWNVPLEQA